MRRALHALDQVPRDGAAQRRMGDPADAGQRGQLRRGRHFAVGSQVALDVLRRDPPPDPGAGHAGGIDPMLADEPPHGGAEPAGVRDRRRGHARRRRRPGSGGAGGRRLPGRDAAEQISFAHRGAGHADLLDQHAGGRRGDLDHGLARADLEEGRVGLDRLADRRKPGADHGLSASLQRLAQDHIDRHGSPSIRRPKARASSARCGKYPGSPPRPAPGGTVRAPARMRRAPPGRRAR